MRVTQRTIQDGWIDSLQKRLETLNGLNRQIGTGQRLDKPADDPSGANRIVRIEEVVARNEQYLRNIEEAVAVQRNTESTLDQVYQRLMRAKSLAVEGANSATDSTDGTLLSMSEEIRGVREGVLQLALTKYQDEYLFSGTAGGAPPFRSGDPRYGGDSEFLRVNMGNNQNVAVNLPGDLAFRESEARSDDPLPAAVTLASNLEFQVGDGTTSVAVSIAGPGTFTPQELADEINGQLGATQINAEARLNGDGTLSIAIADTLRGGELTLGDPNGDLKQVLGIESGTKNLFGMLDDLQTAFESQDPRAVERYLGRLDRGLEDLASQRGQLGSRQRNLEFSRDRIEEYNVTSQTLRAELSGVDLPEAIMRLTAEEQAYQTSLASGARIFNISIIDFLR